jgi:hypothetical protein
VQIVEEDEFANFLKKGYFQESRKLIRRISKINKKGQNTQ